MSWNCGGKRWIVGALLASVVAAVPAGAATTRQAEHAAKRTLREELPVNYKPRVECDRLTARRWWCEFVAEAEYGDTCEGEGITRLYRYGWLVRFRVTYDPYGVC